MTLTEDQKAAVQAWVEQLRDGFTRTPPVGRPVEQYTHDGAP